ncbi:JM117 [macacine gammaherpesvirus 11]|uniref:JM117 n=2 Tax=macacine gammaherpesvirus 11 TaxID=2560570 RepID=G9JMU5_9GAMA|nr:JM117 [Macaca fuscata rhadinovirus]AAT00094.1 JM117 [Macaca fuscata rhadinovirus]AEW87642.1 JM117 [Macaca fuscata rhadinovirus]AEW87812.1 JM117 [Macaca fuscata rhadinovirus]
MLTPNISRVWVNVFPREVFRKLKLTSSVMSEYTISGASAFLSRRPRTPASPTLESTLRTGALPWPLICITPFLTMPLMWS